MTPARRPGLGLTAPVLACFLAIGAAAPPAAAQQTLLSASGSPAISVDAGRIFFLDPQVEFCPSQRARHMSVGGGTVSNFFNITGCPLDGRIIKADGAYVFTITFDNRIARFWSGGPSSGHAVIATPGPGFDLVQKLECRGDWVYWASPYAVGRVNRDGGQPTQVARQTTFRSGMAAAANGFVYWSEGNDGAGRIMRADLASPVAQLVAGTNYNSPGNLATDATFLFWSESNGVIRRALLNGANVTTLRAAVAGGYSVNSVVVDDTHVYWAESTSAGLSRIFKVPKNGGAAVQVGPGNLSFARSLQQDVDQLYWVEGLNGDIRRIRKDSAAVQPDFSWLGLEVTQGIQNIDNSVPVMQGRPTLVRGYARSTLAGYPATAQLSAVRTSNGAVLAGSPMRPSIATMTIPVDASITDARRRNLLATFNWEIPDAWLQNGVTLTATINSDNAISEGVTGNNGITRAIPVYRVPPICLKLRRTRTEQPVYEASGADFASIIRRFHTLVPARQVWLYPQSGLFEKLDCCTVLPPFVYWNQWNVANDKNQMIAQLIVEETFSTNPSDCNAAGAKTHRVAMIGPNVNTGNVSGFANYAWNVSWVKFTTGGSAAFHRPSAGATLAQEIAHNYNGVFGSRWLHVNCGNPDGINNSYPYATNTIGPLQPTAYYGYDYVSRSVIPPGDARDFMSYCTPKWVSDYNWRGLQQVFGLTPIASPPPPPGDYLFLIGFLNPSQTQADVQQVIRIPVGTIPAARLSELLAEQQARTSDDPALAIDLRNAAGGLIRSVNIDYLPMSHEGGHNQFAFTALVEDEPPAASVTVRRRSNNANIGARTASASPPVITGITSPTGGTFDTSLPISWNATDPDGDILTFIVQYSRDNGATWQTIASNVPTTSFVVDAVNLLPGSASTAAPGSSRIRIIASDGFHTAIATSNPFIVPNRAPMPMILEPQHQQVFGSGQSIRFSAMAFDPEHGTLTENNNFRYTVDGRTFSQREFILAEGLPPGTYPVQLRVFDPNGRTSDTVITIQVVDGAPPPPPCAADWDANGVINSSDISAFITTWLAALSTGSSDGDFNGDGFINSQDISAFITAWLAAVTTGC